MIRPSLLAEAPSLDTRADPAGDLRRTVWVLWGRVAIAAAGAHLVFLAVFLFLGLPLMVWVNVASVAIHLCCRWLSVLGRYVPAVVLLVSEVLVHAGIATRFLGPDSGFQFYVLTLVLPLLITLNGSVASKLGWIAAIGVYYGVLDAWTRHLPPVYAIDPQLVDGLRYFNLAGMLVIMAFVSLTYYSLVADAEQSLRALATTDPLTGLHNRRRMLDIARNAQANAMRHHRGLCVLLCDIDHFKNVNDGHGHEVGDLALQQVGQVLRASLRENDFVARWGGEEFLVLVVDADLDLAAQAAERMRRAVAQARVEVPAGPALALTVTIGVARLREGDTIDAAIARADTALYRGKADGRNRVTVTEPEPEPEPAGTVRAVAAWPSALSDAPILRVVQQL